jgi:hypothetical protein
MTAADDEANRRFFEALIGGPHTRWHEAIKQRNVRILGIPWFQLPLFIRQVWWEKTDYHNKLPSPEFTARMPELLAAAQARLEADRREIADDAAAGLALLRQARQPPCEQCLLTPPCRVRCLRSLGVSEHNRRAKSQHRGEPHDR